LLYYTNKDAAYRWIFARYFELSALLGVLNKEDAKKAKGLGSGMRAES